MPLLSFFMVGWQLPTEPAAINLEGIRRCLGGDSDKGNVRPFAKPVYCFCMLAKGQAVVVHLKRLSDMLIRCLLSLYFYTLIVV